MARNSGMQKVGTERFVFQAQVNGVRRTKRFTGTPQEAKAAHAAFRAELMKMSQALQTSSSSGLPGLCSLSRCPTLSEWLTGRYPRWQERAQNECSRRKLESPKRYLLASDLAEMRLEEVDTAAINAYVEWRLQVGPLTFAKRKDGERYQARQDTVGAQTINKSLKVLSSALRLAFDEGVITRVPKIAYLPEDDAKAIVPPTMEQFRAQIQAAEQLRSVGPHLPEVIELLGEFGLRAGELFRLPWASIDWTLGEGENRGAIRVEEQRRTRVVGDKPWVPKNKKFRIVPFTIRGRAILEKLHSAAKPRADELVIPNRSGLPYIRLDDGPSKGGGAGIWERLREVSGVAGVGMSHLRHFFAVQNLLRGVPITVVSAWMGHSSIQLTVKRYGRWAHEAKEQWRWAALRDERDEAIANAPRHLKSVM